MRRGNLAAVSGALAGVKPVVVAIVVEAMFKLGGRALKRQVHITIACTAFIGIFFFHIPFPLVILVAGLIGLLGARLWPRLFTSPPAGEKSALAPTVIDDTASPLAHTLPSRTRAQRTFGIGLLLWVLPLILLTLWQGWESFYTQIYRFFTLAALVTFGGAYAVLAYVTQAAVGTYGWLTHAQAVDGLALAETTPGPLIMVLQFVGFMSGWDHPGDMPQATSAVLSALITTYTTFLPSFLFIFLGAPYIEKLRGNKNLTAALSGVTAAVVGVVLNLALIFGIAVIWPSGLAQGANWIAATLSVLAFLALYYYKIDVLWVVFFGAALGWGWQFFFS